MRREAGLVDHEEVGSRDGGPTLARNLLTFTYRYHMKRQVCEVLRKHCGKVVAAIHSSQRLAY